MLHGVPGCNGRCGGRNRRGRLGLRSCRGRRHGRWRRSRGGRRIPVPVFPIGRRSLVPNPQGAFDDLDFRSVITAQPLQPSGPGGGVFNPGVVAEGAGSRAPAVRGRDPTHHRDADLRPETRPEAQDVAHRVASPLGEVEIPQFRVDLLEIGNGRDDAGFQDFGRNHILDPHGHGMARRPLGIGDENPVCRFLETVAQREHLGRGAPAPGGGVGLVGDKHHLRRYLVAIKTMVPFHLGNQLFHDVADMVDVKARSVERAVGDHAPEHLADRADAPLTRRLGALEYDGRSPHPHDQAVAPPVERDRLLLHFFARGRRPGSQEAGAEPSEQVVGGDVVGRDHDHPTAASGTDPVARDPHRLRAARTGSVGGGVRSPCADVLGELGVPHGEDPEQEPPVEMIRLLLDLLFECRDAPVELPRERLPGAGARTQGFQFRQPGAPLAVLVEVGHDLRVGVVTRERGGEQYAGVVPDVVRQHPAVGQLRPLGGGLVAHHQRDSGVAQRVDARADGQLGHAVERGHPVFGKTEIADDVELLRTGREFDHVGRALDVLEPALAPLRLHEPGDVLLDHLPAQLFRNRADEDVPAQHPLHVFVAEDAVHAREAEGGARDAHVDRRLLRLSGPAVNRHPAIQEFREQPAQFHDAARLRRRLHGRRSARRLRRHDGRFRPQRRHRRRRGDDRLRRLHRGNLPDPQPRGIKPAQGQVQGGRLADSRVVGEEREHPLPVAQYVLHETVEDAFGPHLHEDAGAGVIEGVESLDELDRGGDLSPQQVDHLRDHPRPHRVEFPGDVGDDGDDRGLDVHRPQDPGQAFARRGDDIGVEGVAHLQHARHVARLLERLHRLLDPGGTAADDGLLGAVDVGDDDVIVDRFEHLLDFADRAESGGHQAVVLHGAFGHFIAAGADGPEGVFEGDRPGRHQRSVLPEAVPHDHVGSDSVGADQARQGRFGGQHRRLRDRRLFQAVFGLRQGGFVRLVEIDAAGEAPADQRRHRAVGLGENLGHHRLGFPERPQHVDVL